MQDTAESFCKKLFERKLLELRTSNNEPNLTQDEHGGYEDPTVDFAFTWFCLGMEAWDSVGEGNAGTNNA